MPASAPPRATRRRRTHTHESAPDQHIGVTRSVLANHSRMLAWALPVGTLSEVIDLLVPILLGIVIDRGLVAGDLTATIWGAIGIVAIRLVGTAAWLISFLAIQKACLYERHRIRVAITGAALDPRTPPLDRPAGEVLSISTSDADKASDVLDLVSWVGPACLAILGAGVYLTVLDPWLGLLMAIGIIVMVIVIRVITPTLSNRYDAQQSEAAEAASTATDLVHGLRILQGLGVQSRARRVYRRRSRVALNAALVNARFSGLSSGLATLVTTAMLGGIVVVAAFRAIDGHMTIGTLIAAVGVARYVMGMLNGLAGAPVWWASLSTSARRVRILMADMGRTVDDPDLSVHHLATQRDDRGAGAGAELERRPAAGGLTLENVTTGSLEGLSVCVPDGRIVALACADGHDADAVIDTITASGGSGARVGEREITFDNRTRMRADLLVEPHVVDLFDGTLRDQLATRVPASTPTDGSDDSWAHEALHAAGARDLLGILPQGFDTRILDRGANLSGGQRQRIALARAVAADAPVLVLHDPTTAVDAVTEQHIAEALIAARRHDDRATLIVTRSPALLNHADEVVFVNDGVVIAEGAHSELMEREDYRRVVQR